MMQAVHMNLSIMKTQYRASLRSKGKGRLYYNQEHQGFYGKQGGVYLPQWEGSQRKDLKAAGRFWGVPGILPAVFVCMKKAKRQSGNVQKVEV